MPENPQGTTIYRNPFFYAFHIHIESTTCTICSFPYPSPYSFPHFLSGYIFQLNFIMSHSLATPARAGDADKPATSCDFDFNDWIYRSLEIIAASSRAAGRGGRKSVCKRERENNCWRLLFCLPSGKRCQRATQRARLRVEGGGGVGGGGGGAGAGG